MTNTIYSTEIDTSPGREVDGTCVDGFTATVWSDTFRLNTYDCLSSLTITTTKHAPIIYVRVIVHNQPVTVIDENGVTIVEDATDFTVDPTQAINVLIREP